MSDSEKSFYRKMKLLAFAAILSSFISFAGNMVTDHFANKASRETVKENSENIKTIHKYYMKFSDYEDVKKLEKELAAAYRIGSNIRIEKLEAELSEMRNWMFTSETRNGKPVVNK